MICSTSVIMLNLRYKLMTIDCIYGSKIRLLKKFKALTSRRRGEGLLHDKLSIYQNKRFIRRFRALIGCFFSHSFAAFWKAAWDFPLTANLAWDFSNILTRFSRCFLVLYFKNNHKEKRAIKTIDMSFIFIFTSLKHSA